MGRVVSSRIPVRQHCRGVYVYVKYVGGGALVSESSATCACSTTVLKYQRCSCAKTLDICAVEVNTET